MYFIITASVTVKSLSVMINVNFAVTGVITASVCNVIEHGWGRARAARRSNMPDLHHDGHAWVGS